MSTLHWMLVIGLLLCGSLLSACDKGRAAPAEGEQTGKSSEMAQARDGQPTLTHSQPAPTHSQPTPHPKAETCALNRLVRSQESVTDGVFSLAMELGQLRAEVDAAAAAPQPSASLFGHPRLAALFAVVDKERPFLVWAGPVTNADPRFHCRVPVRPGSLDEASRTAAQLLEELGFTPRGESWALAFRGGALWATVATMAGDEPALLISFSTLDSALPLPSAEPSWAGTFDGCPSLAFELDVGAAVGFRSLWAEALGLPKESVLAGFAEGFQHLQLSLTQTESGQRLRLRATSAGLTPAPRERRPQAPTAAARVSADLDFLRRPPWLTEAQMAKAELWGLEQASASDPTELLFAPLVLFSLPSMTWNEHFGGTPYGRAVSRAQFFQFGYEGLNPDGVAWQGALVVSEDALAPLLDDWVCGAQVDCTPPLLEGASGAFALGEERVHYLLSKSASGFVTVLGASSEDRLAEGPTEDAAEFSLGLELGALIEAGVPVFLEQALSELQGLCEAVEGSIRVTDGGAELTLDIRGARPWVSLLVKWEQEQRSTLRSNQLALALSAIGNELVKKASSEGRFPEAAVACIESEPAAQRHWLLDTLGVGFENLVPAAGVCYRVSADARQFAILAVDGTAGRLCLRGRGKPSTRWVVDKPLRLREAQACLP